MEWIFEAARKLLSQSQYKTNQTCKFHILKVCTKTKEEDKITASNSIQPSIGCAGKFNIGGKYEIPQTPSFALTGGEPAHRASPKVDFATNVILTSRVESSSIYVDFLR